MNGRFGLWRDFISLRRSRIRRGKKHFYPHKCASDTSLRSAYATRRLTPYATVRAVRMFLSEKSQDFFDRLTQKDFAVLLNIAPTTLNGYIKNKRQPDFALVKQIAFLLNVSVDYLLDYNNGQLNADIKELSLISKIRKMDEKERNIVYGLVNLIDKNREE